MMALITASNARWRAGRERRSLLGVAQEHVQELVADHRFHFCVRAAVPGHEFQVHLEARALFAGDGERRNAFGEAHVEDLERRADRERVLVDQLVEQAAESLSLLIIDELGFEPMDPQEASAFFRPGDLALRPRLDPHHHQQVGRDWPELLAGDEVLSTAILDRLLHKAHVLNIKGRSYRLRDLENALTASNA